MAARALDGLTPLPVVVERDRGQAEAVLSIDAYVRRRLTPTIVRRAREMATKHRTVLEKVGTTYGVQPRYLVAVWGLESNFGRFTGVRPTVQALATLAFDGRRGALFRNELFDALRIVERGHASLESMKGRGPARWASRSSCRRVTCATPRTSTATACATSGAIQATSSPRSPTT